MSAPTPLHRRWRLVLGGDDESASGCGLSAEEHAMDAALSALYDNAGAEETGPRSGGLGASAPRVARWLGDIRQYFPNRVVEVMQKDAIDRLGLKKLILEPEVLRTNLASVILQMAALGLGEVAAFPFVALFGIDIRFGLRFDQLQIAQQFADQAGEGRLIVERQTEREAANRNPAPQAQPPPRGMTHHLVILLLKRRPGGAPAGQHL